ncbi:MAG: chorismate mutase [Parasporobacterium sp.]|nr:chorismate mutase [Parasporobacterium sp.]
MDRKITDLEETREKITEVDRLITDLFVRRMQLAEDVALYKAAKGMPVLDAAKEAKKLEQIAGQMPEEFREYGISLYEKIFELSRDYQQKLIAGSKDLND